MKEGKVGRKDGQMLPGEDEPLHALVTANTMENVKKAVEQVRVLFVNVVLFTWSLSSPLATSSQEWGHLSLHRRPHLAAPSHALLGLPHSLGEFLPEFSA